MASRKMIATGETPYEPLMSMAYGFCSSSRSESGRWAKAGPLSRSTASKAMAMRMVFSPLKAGPTAVRAQATSARPAALHGVRSAHAGENQRRRSRFRAPGFGDLERPARGRSRPRQGERLRLEGAESEAKDVRVP